MGAPALGGFIYDRFGPLAVVGLIEGILAIDLILRLLIAEPGNGEQASDEAPQEEAGANETAPLHPTGPRCEMFADASKRAGSTSTLFSWIPILHCFEDLPFTASVALTTINATLMGAFNATIPLHGKEHFGFDSTGAGLLLLPIAVARVIAGPLGGHLVDRIGSRKVAVAGYLVMSTGLFLVPATMSMSKALAVASLAALLALAGTGLAVVGSACWVEGMCAVRRYHAAHWYLFGDAGPYASLQALNMMTFQLGLAVGPLAAGALRDWYVFTSWF
jgi:MFS family permease